jgi:sugar lactone lactonase YvrE
VQTATNTTLTVVVPNRAGTGPIRVSVNSISDISSVDFNYDWIGVVSILAGNTQGYADGTGTAAQFSHPAGLGLDASGNIYVADYANSKVRKVTATGVVTTLPGRIPPYPGGPNTDYGLPNDVAVDASGNIFIVEANSNVVSRITPGGTVSVFAGGGPSAYADGTGIAALFHTPAGITIDPNDNIYVADLNNHRIRKITPGAVVTTLAGSTQGYAEGTGTSAFFNEPFSLTMDVQGNLYISDYFNNRIRKLTTGGVVTTFAGNGYSGSVDGPGTIAEILHPSDITINTAGKIYVGDADNKIRMISTTGFVSSIGTFVDQNGAPVSFSGIYGIAANNSGIIYIADYYNNKIWKMFDVK